jgi:hypothetical protein
VVAIADRPISPDGLLNKEYQLGGTTACQPLSDDMFDGIENLVQDV